MPGRYVRGAWRERDASVMCVLCVYTCAGVREWCV